MENIPPYLRIYQQILKDLENAFPFLNVPKRTSMEGFWLTCGLIFEGQGIYSILKIYDGRKSRR